ncbi:MAG TPA: two-component regulator propeller domain-containing protein [Bryobacteraceae bacterium]|nr:two-component regulator propeller domain-containing protein [Bryobacteraceae bacterium]
MSVLIGLSLVRSLLALNPAKAVTQYTKTLWTQAQGLPHDTIRAITQTSDGYLWLATDEGLARFDGYSFEVFDEDRGTLPTNTVESLAAGSDGDLWIGSNRGLIHYKDQHFQTYATAAGLPDNDVTQVLRDSRGRIWAIAGGHVCQFRNERFQIVDPGPDLPLKGVRTIYEDSQHDIWIGGFGGVARLAGERFVSVFKTRDPKEMAARSLLHDSQNNLWMGSNRVRVLTANGQIRARTLGDGLSSGPIRTLAEDRDGNIWIGTTSGGLTRFRDGRFASLPVESAQGRDYVHCIYEDRDGDLWVGMNSGLYRFRDDNFTTYSKSEGLPSDEPTAVYQDRHGALWIGFLDAGLVRLDDSGMRVYDRKSGLPHNEVFAIRESPGGDLLVGTRGGLVRLHQGQFRTYLPNPHPGRQFVADALEDRRGQVWIANRDGLSKLTGQGFRNVIPGGLTNNDYMFVLCEGSGSVLWAGSRGNGLWRVEGDDIRHFTTADGLSSNQIRALVQSQDGTLWIATAGGGLNSFAHGRFLHFSSKQGLLSDNVLQVQDDGRGWLWLTTTRGICRVSKQQLADLAAHRIAVLNPANYGVEDGLRSPRGQSAVSSDGRFWTPTPNGLAVFDLQAKVDAIHAPEVHVVEARADGKPIDLRRPTPLAPGTRTLEVRYIGIHLGAPERVRYFFKLEGLDTAWVAAAGRRTATYNNLGHGRYRFVVWAEAKNSRGPEAAYGFEILPYFYETWWFRCCAVLMAAGILVFVYRLHLRQIRNRFALVLEERARLAREIHDTLAQDFVGISSQLKAVSISMDMDREGARRHLDLAMRMVRHSLKEARRAVMDLRSPALYGQDLGAALQAETRRWTAGSPLHVQVHIPDHRIALPQETEQNLLRIAQEAVTNASKHANAKNVWIRMNVESRNLSLCIADDGRGFVRPDPFSPKKGHFGLIGMRERAERLGGRLTLETKPDQGTQVEVTVPLP